jgi:hypothetical protein
MVLNVIQTDFMMVPLWKNNENLDL